jgi:SAM-dependent methyltransferase
MTDDYRATNRANWNERVAVHPDTDYYDIEGFLDGESSLYPMEREELAAVVDPDTSLLHPMCHFGLDTLSWAREARDVTGVDFSPAAVDAARDLATRAGIENASFHEADVLDLDLDREFDVVFTTFGVVGWLDDLDALADTVATHLRDGGTYYLADIHPFTEPFHDVDAEGAQFGDWGFSYFRTDPLHLDADGSYADPDRSFDTTETVEFVHTMGEIVTALCDAGLRVEFLHDHPWADFPMYEQMERDDHGRWWLPDDVPVEMPLTFSLRATKA